MHLILGIVIKIWKIKWSQIEHVQAITSIYMHGFQNYFAQVFSWRCSSAILKHFFG